ncbi:MAG: hypothetical protein EXR62_08655 [Chloroflexi bacterium]|nr:hypothetical protein [Chloroflexota bacterium]
MNSVRLTLPLFISAWAIYLLTASSTLQKAIVIFGNLARSDQQIMDHRLQYSAVPPLRLLVIIYDPATGKRLEISAPDGRQLGESFTLAALQ